MSNYYKAVSATAVVALGILVASFVAFAPLQASAATILTDGFGTGSTDSSFNESPIWTEGGNSGEDAEKRASTGGTPATDNDTPSPDGDRFAVMFGEDGYICINLSAEGYEGLSLSYYWRGDNDAEDNSDFGIVETRGSGSCSSSGGWTTRATHELDDGAGGGEVWSSLQTVDLSSLDGDTSWYLRFRTSASSDDEHFRIDGVNLTSEDPDVIPPSVAITDPFGGADGETITSANQTFTIAAEEGATLECKLDDGSFVSCDTTTSHEVTGMSDGEHTFTVKATDGALNSAEDTMTFTVDTSVPAACDDGIDNDEDELIDEADPGCEGPEDESEFNEPPVVAACSDAADNDGDELIDEADPGCTGPEDDDETDPSPEEGVPPICSDGYTLIEGQCISDDGPEAPLCPDGTTFNSGSGLCEDTTPQPPNQCPEGYEFNGSLCVETDPVNPEEPNTTEPSCPENMEAGEGGCYEAPVEPSCQDGQEPTDGMCVPEPREPFCPDDTHLNSAGTLCIEDEDNGGGGGRNTNMGGGGSVLGAETGPEEDTNGGSCMPLLNAFLRAGSTNSAQIKLLQEFLNKELGLSLDVDGIYDGEVTSAVNTFQLKYWQEVLAPWVPFGLPNDHTPTGNVFKLTQWKINTLSCPGLNTPPPVIP